MSAQKLTVRGVLTGIAGMLGLSALSGLLVTVMVAPALAVTGMTATSTIGIFDSLPEFIEIGQQPERNRIMAIDSAGEGGYSQIATIYDQNRQEVAYEQISQYALDAAVDGEDRRFFEHGGVDLASAIRAAVGNIAADGIESGSSTLSMQLVKNIFVQQALEMETEEERKAAYDSAVAPTFDRKLKEMKLAIGLEKRYTKKEILTAYLNIANFGNATYGIQAAAQQYYGVDAADLELHQAASLLAIVQYPNQRHLADADNYSENETRRDFILGMMLEAGHITQTEYDEAYNTPVSEETINLQPATNGCIVAYLYARWFCDYVVKSVKDFEFLGANEEEREANWKRGGYTLYTTLDLDIQVPAQDAVWAYAPPSETAFALGGAAVTVQPGTGRVLVMAVNKYFDDSLEPPTSEYGAVNYATDYEYGGSTGQQPASTYKVFTLLEWLKQGKGTEERILGDPVRNEPGSKWTDSCTGLTGGIVSANNNSGERGIYTIRQGTIDSINGVFYRMAQQLDICAINNTAAELGIKRADGRPLENVIFSVLGSNEISPLSLATAYASISALGRHCEPMIVDAIVTPDGHEAPGQTPKCNQTSITPEVAATAIDVLKGVMVSGNQRYSNPFNGIPIFGKTGTNDDGNQTWMAAATTNAATVTWVGNTIKPYTSILRVGYSGVDGIRLRHYIQNPIQTALGHKYGGGDWPAADPRLLTGTGVEVPNVIGMSPEAARPLLEGLGFSFAIGDAVDSDRTAGVIAATSPGVGTLSARGAVITVHPSLGNLIPIPDVVGDGTVNSFNAARSMLNAAGFMDVVSACAEVDPGDPSVGKVVAQSPGGGTVANPANTVTLTVAQDSSCGGPPPPPGP